MSIESLFTHEEEQMILVCIQSEIIQHGRTMELVPEGSKAYIALKANIDVLVSIRDKMCNLIVKKGIEKKCLSKKP